MIKHIIPFYTTPIQLRAIADRMDKDYETRTKFPLIPQIIEIDGGELHFILDYIRYKDELIKKAALKNLIKKKEKK